MLCRVTVVQLQVGRVVFDVRLFTCTAVGPTSDVWAVALSTVHDAVITERNRAHPRTRNRIIISVRFSFFPPRGATVLLECYALHVLLATYVGDTYCRRVAAQVPSSAARSDRRGTEHWGPRSRSRATSPSRDAAPHRVRCRRTHRVVRLSTARQATTLDANLRACP